MKLDQSNISKLMAIATFQGFTFYSAFEKIYFQNYGLSVTKIAILTFIFSIAVILLEVPSGVLSDRWVRKHVMSLSILSAIVALLILATGSNFFQFSLAMFFAAVSFVMNSGTNNSILFDSLKETSLLGKFEKYLAIRRILSAIGFAMASIIGGWVSSKYDISTSIWLTLASLIPALVLSMSLHEPIFHKTTGELSYLKHIAKTAKFLISTRYLINIIILLVVIMSSHILIEDYSQLYYFGIGFGLMAVGVITFFDGLKEITANYIGSIVPKKINNLPFMYGSLLFIMALVLFLSSLELNILGVLFIFIASAIFYIIDVPLLSDFHNKLDSKIRTTSESFMNMVTELVKMLIAVGFAWIADMYGIHIAFGVLGIFILIYSIYYWIFTYPVFERFR